MSKIPKKNEEAAPKIVYKDKIVEVEKEFDSVQIAGVAHEVNRAYCLALGDTSQPEWKDAPEWQAKSAIDGVEFHRNNPEAGPEASHVSWLIKKVEDGWTYGPIKSPDLKKHPCIVPFEDLPVEQQAKDFIFRAVVHALLERL